MKNLEDYKSEIYKCSKCGLCQSVCPVYKITKNECALSRGKFTILNGILKKDLKLNKSVIKNIDLCLNCNACRDFCPSEINAKDIFAALKHDYRKTIGYNFLNLSSGFKLFMNILKLSTHTYRLFRIDKIITKLEPLLKKTGIAGRYIISLNSAVGVRVKRKKYPLLQSYKGKVIFFEGCFNKYINHSSKNASLNLIQEMNYEIIPINFECCSVSKYYNGDFKTFEDNAKKNIAKIPREFDYIICDCDSCLSVLKSYKELFNLSSEITDKMISLNDFLIKNHYKKNIITNENVTYHKPCHNCDNHEFLLKTLNLNTFKEPDNEGSCCGFAGDFILKHYKISKQISQKKALVIKNTSAEIVVTSCPSCILGLKHGLLIENHDAKVMNISEYINLN